MGLRLRYQKGQTPIAEEEKEGLLINTISTQGDLDEFEQYNIEKAVEWTLSRNFNNKELLTAAFIQKIHQKMFHEVWSWAGDFRKTDKNIGVPWHSISIELQKLLKDAKYWYENGIFPPDECVIRFKHRLVSIHCFPNGNGRHARLVADVLIGQLYGKQVFSWGKYRPEPKSEIRGLYIASLKCADRGSIQALLEFARS